MRKQRKRRLDGRERKATTGSIALDLFVDRLEQCDRFVHAIHEPELQDSTLFLYGTVGNGKSLLMNHMRRNLSKQVDPDSWNYLKSINIRDRLEQIAATENSAVVAVGYLDLTTTAFNIIERLLTLWRQLSMSEIRLPLFNLAVTTFLQKTNQLTAEYVRSHFPTSEVSLASRILELLESVPYLELPAKALHLLDDHLNMWFQRFSLRRKLHPQDVEEILYMDPHTELIEALPEIFALDLGCWLRENQKISHAVLFVDSYDAIWGELQGWQGDHYFGQDEWLRCILHHVSPSNHITVVVAGQEPPNWESAPNYPISNVQLLPVNEFTRDDADEYLSTAGIVPGPLFERLREDSRGDGPGYHPFLLGLNAELVRKAIQDGTSLLENDLRLDEGVYAHRDAQVLDRLLRRFSDEERSAVMALGACRTFDREVYRCLGESLHFQTSRTRFDRIINSLLTFELGPGRYRTHDLVRTLPRGKDREVQTEAHQALEEFYGPPTLENRSLGQLIESIFHANQAEESRGFQLWSDAVEAALRYSSSELRKALLELAPYLRIESSDASAVLLAFLSQHYFLLWRYDESITTGLAAAEYFRSSLDGSFQDADRLTDLGNVLVSIGVIYKLQDDPTSSVAVIREAIDAFQQALGFDPDNYPCLSNLSRAWVERAELEAQLGDSDASESSASVAKELLKKALALNDQDNFLWMHLALTEMRSAELLVKRGRLSDSEQQYAAAIMHINRSLDLVSNYPAAHHNHGLILRSRGRMRAHNEQRAEALRDYRSALQALRHSLRLAPDNVLALTSKVQICEELGWLIHSWEGVESISQIEQLYREALDSVNLTARIAPSNQELQAAAERLNDRIEGLRAAKQ